MPEPEPRPTETRLPATGELRLPTDNWERDIPVIPPGAPQVGRDLDANVRNQLVNRLIDFIRSY